jgi:hypothetical protein
MTTLLCLCTTRPLLPTGLPCAQAQPQIITFQHHPKKTQTIKKQILSLLGLAAPKIGNSALSQQQ